MRLRDGVVFRVPNTLGHFRLGFTIKARANAVLRNLLKRRVREAFRTNVDALGPFDYNVVIPNRVKLGRVFSIHFASKVDEALRLGKPLFLASRPREERSR